MEKLLNNKQFCRILVFLLLVLLIGIRVFEKQLFYDPLMLFFKGNYQNQNLPNFESAKLFLNISLRYFMNTLLSLGIVYIIFKDKAQLVFLCWVYLGLYVLLILVFAFLLLNAESPDYLVLFYFRRFLIQPIPLLLFVPALFYQKMMNKS
ncbi:exosortase F system-associated protein [Flavobacterium chuncheonense]|uniref:Exosortase F system-associated protein n=1 Tax=Flavobacterium chuncheonense TaxID=2026653 RepID=A0ABW5YLA4_9FLAO